VWQQAHGQRCVARFVILPSICVSHESPQRMTFTDVGGREGIPLARGSKPL
jgi:hypothetical protein